MDREQEEIVLRITARYIAELRAGQQPRLSDYLSRYPQYADAIADFVSYYHATELDVPEEIDLASPLSHTSRAALYDAWKRVLHSESAANNAINTLQMAANSLGKSFSHLAMEIGLSTDILAMLDKRIIDSTTVPIEACKRLAKALQQPLATVEMYLGLAEQKQITKGLAEASSSYRVELRSNVQKLSFREAVEQSMNLSNEQKDTWLGILTKEGL